MFKIWILNQELPLCMEKFQNTLMLHLECGLTMPIKNNFGPVIQKKFLSKKSLHLRWAVDYTIVNRNYNHAWRRADSHDIILQIIAWLFFRFCQKTYPDIEVTNIVEANDNVTVCSGEDCTSSYTVLPYRCLGKLNVVCMTSQTSCY